MNRIAGVVVMAAALTAAATGARAAELSDQDRAELRQRAQEFNNQRSRDPDFQPGQGRAAPVDSTSKSRVRAREVEARGDSAEIKRDIQRLRAGPRLK